MVADILYLIFTLKIAVLACFMQKSKKPASPWTTLSDYRSRHTPSCKKSDVPIFFLDYPLIIIKIASYSLAGKYTCGYEFEVFSDFSKI